MPLKLLLDENLRHASLLTALAAHQGLGRYPLEVARVGDPSCPPLGCDDDELIRWAAERDRIVCSLDARTLGRALASRLAAGDHSPGIILLRNDLSVAEILELLQLVTHVSDREEWQDAVRWIP
jgi:hypothetical protein